MDTGKILVGFAFILLSVALTVTPSHALAQRTDCEVTFGIEVPAEELSVVYNAVYCSPLPPPGHACEWHSDPDNLP